MGQGGTGEGEGGGACLRGGGGGYDGGLGGKEGWKEGTRRERGLWDRGGGRGKGCGEE